ncbi:extracellular serine-rich protein [Calycina marina]|uniref:Extracellular serine-rich protein n=1 Tax=Calycina marina TaxID=1763456 RepID=A0A9P8CHA9_9HELO|nr:extracellular serine-rich protein [Calycina marina]
MQFTTIALSALSVASALADITVHVVRVGSVNGSLAYYPNNLVAAMGDMVQFQFAPANHTVTQSTFDQPCQPISAFSNVTGIHSGFMPVSANDSMTPTYTILVNSTTPMWLYCAQGMHCQKGMTMVINENTSANATRSLANFQTLAGLAATTVEAGPSVSNGTASTVGIPESSSSASAGTDSSSSDGTAVSSGTASESAASSTGVAASSSDTATSQTTSSATSLAVPAFAGLLALSFALLI